MITVSVSNRCPASQVARLAKEAATHQMSLVKGERWIWGFVVT